MSKKAKQTRENQGYDAGVVEQGRTEQRCGVSGWYDASTITGWLTGLQQCKNGVYGVRVRGYYTGTSDRRHGPRPVMYAGGGAATSKA